MACEATCSREPCMAHSLNSALAWSREARGETAALLRCVVGGVGCEVGGVRCEVGGVGCEV